MGRILSRGIRMRWLRWFGRNTVRICKSDLTAILYLSAPAIWDEHCVECGAPLQPYSPPTLIHMDGCTGKERLNRVNEIIQRVME